MENYINKHKEKIQKTPGGELCQVFGDKENAACSIALVKMDENSNGLKHYHDNITEIYLFTKGNGKIIINEHENIINDGDCYIIKPNNVHYISAETEMEFACICTPPWTEEHEIHVEDRQNGNNITKYEGLGVIQKLGKENEHSVRLIEIQDEFKPTINMEKYRRVYYFIEGTGIINIDNNEYEIKPGSCYEIFENSVKYIKTNNKLRFVVVCDIIKQN